MKKIVCNVVVNFLLLSLLGVAFGDFPVVDKAVMSLNEFEICGLLLVAIFCWGEIQRPN